jgi:hypothetical protein
LRAHDPGRTGIALDALQALLKARRLGGARGTSAAALSVRASGSRGADLSYCSDLTDATPLANDSREASRAAEVTTPRRFEGASGNMTADTAREGRRTAGRARAGGTRRGSQASRHKKRERAHGAEQHPSVPRGEHVLICLP